MCAELDAENHSFLTSVEVMKARHQCAWRENIGVEDYMNFCTERNEMDCGSLENLGYVNCMAIRVLGVHEREREIIRENI